MSKLWTKVEQKRAISKALPDSWILHLRENIKALSNWDAKERPPTEFNEFYDDFDPRSAYQIQLLSINVSQIAKSANIFQDYS